MRLPRGFVVLLVSGALLMVGTPASAGSVRGPHDVVVPPGVTAGVAVFDRHTGTFAEQLNPDLQFRSASVVKLLIVLDYLWDLGPAFTIPEADRKRLDVMLRSSDDDAASYFWDRNGGGRIIDRMVPRLGLTGTARPPATHPGYWGYVALTAADTVRIYRYLLDSAPTPVRDYVMGNLSAATRCGTDGFDQYFGIASVFDSPVSIKQGWSGFAQSGSCAPAAGPHSLDLNSEALHTTGTVGPDHRAIVAVFTLHPDGTPYGKAYSDVTRLTRSLTVPGAVRAAGSWLTTSGSGVRVRSAPTTAGAVLGTLPTEVDVLVSCQRRGQLITAPPRSSDWWAYLPKYGGYVTNVYVGSGGPKLPGVPDCA